MPRRNKGPHLKWRKDRQCWEIQWFEHGSRRRVTTGTEDRGEAERQLADFLADQRPKGPSHPAERYVSAALADYAQEHAPATTDPERIAYAIQALIPFWGELTVGDIREATCREYANVRAASPGTIRKELGTLRAAINWDFRAGNVTAAPAVWLPPRPEHKDRWLTRSEAARLLNAARGTQKGRLHLPLFILIGLYTGARREAILSLRWPQVDLDRGLIDFNPPGRTRTKKGRPIIPIPRRLMTFLRLARKRGTDTGHVISYIQTITERDPVTGVQRKVRLPMPVKNTKRGFQRAAIAAGFVTGYRQEGESKTKEGWPYSKVAPVTDVTPHVLRHTSASWMVQRGVSFHKVAKYIGHKDSRTTEQIYAHHAPDYLADAKTALDG